MQAVARLLILMILSPAIGSYLGLLYSGLFRESFHTFYASPFMHAGALLMLGIALGIFVLSEWFGLGIPPRVGPFRRFYLVLLALAFFSLVLGLSQYWPVISAVADFAYMVASVFVYFIGRMAMRSARLGAEDDARLVRLWLGCSALCAIASLPGIPLSSTIVVVGPSAILTITVSLIYSLAFRHNYRTMIILATPLVVDLAQMNRTTIMVIVLTFTICIAAGGALRLASRVLPAMAVLAAVLALAGESILDSVDFQGTHLAQRLQELSEFSLDHRSSKEIPLSQRLFEMDLALTQLGKRSPAYWVTGAGAGATLDMTQSRDMSVRENQLLGEGQVHNIHLLPIAILYRYGLVGLAIYGYFGVIGLWALYGAIRRARRERTAGMELIASTYLLLSMVGGLFASGFFFTDWLPSFCAAYLDHAAWLRAEAAPATTSPTAPRARALSGRG